MLPFEGSDPVATGVFDGRSNGITRLYAFCVYAGCRRAFITVDSLNLPRDRLEWCKIQQSALVIRILVAEMERGKLWDVIDAKRSVV